MHTVESTAANTSPLLPGGQLIQAFSLDDPCAVKYFPGVHGWHAEADVAPSNDNHVPSSQGKHDDAPSESTYWPAGHCVHLVSPEAEILPFEQMSQVNEDVLLSIPILIFPATQDLHTLLPASDKRPEGHDLHEAASEISLKVFSKQDSQTS